MWELRGVALRVALEAPGRWGYVAPIARSDHVDRSIYSGVPADFPIAAIPSALSGAHPKMSLVEEDGKFYAPGTSPSQVASAFEVCEDLVVQMVPTVNANWLCFRVIRRLR